MTICIAAVCDYRRALVLASDQMIDFGWYSGEAMALKISAIHQDWVAMFSGEDVTQVQPLLRSIWTDLHDDNKGHSLERVEDSVIKIWQKRLRQQQINCVLSQYGFDDMDSFRKTISENPEAFSSAQEEVKKVSLGCELLIAGFDESEVPHIFTVQHPGSSHHYDMFGFRAIGSGAPVAENFLLFRSFNNRLALGPSIYRICSAKFMAELASGVGAATSVLVGRVEKKPNRSVVWTEMSELKLNQTRKTWEKTKALPSSVEAIITKSIDDGQSFRRQIIR